MFKIQKNQVFLSRGESAVYAREITLDDKYRTPYMLLSSYDNPKISVKLKANKNDKEAIVEWISDIGDELPKFTTKTVVNINSTSDVEKMEVLYRLKENDSYKYYYLNGDVTLNDNITSTPRFQTYIKFTSNNTEYDGIEITVDGNLCYIKGESSTSVCFLPNHTWANDAYKKIVFHETPKDDLLDWLTTTISGDTKNSDLDLTPLQYRCIFRFDIQSSDTQQLRPATYYYSITFLAGTDENDYKEVWLEPTEFIIGGSY